MMQFVGPTAIWLFWISVFLILYSYFHYPCALFALHSMSHIRRDWQCLTGGSLLLSPKTSHQCLWSLLRTMTTYKNSYFFWTNKSGRSFVRGRTLRIDQTMLRPTFFSKACLLSAMAVYLMSRGFVTDHIPIHVQGWKAIVRDCTSFCTAVFHQPLSHQDPWATIKIFCF
jgi:hypothetical protein